MMRPCDDELSYPGACWPGLGMDKLELVCRLAWTWGDFFKSQTPKTTKISSLLDPGAWELACATPSPSFHFNFAWNSSEHKVPFGASIPDEVS